jgi:hypothetical protein
MATSFKTLTQADKTITRTMLHESIPITGTLLSGTYATASSEHNVGRGVNIKTFSHGMFQSVYDYPYASSSANHLFDITFGCSTKTAGGTTGGGHSCSGSTTVQVAKKVNIYSQMAQILAGYDTGSNIRRFDVDGDLSAGEKHDNAIFLNFARLLTKDEIKKGSFSMTIGTGSNYNTPFSSHEATITDSGAATNYKINSPAGEYGVLTLNNVATQKVGLIYYQAGIVVLTSSVFNGNSGGTRNAVMHANTGEAALDGKLIADVSVSGTIDQIADAVRHRIRNISFNNTTELNSSIYFCRANAHEFNYSSNPTYIDSNSRIRVKDTGRNNDANNPPTSYVTTVGLYSFDNELLAVAKLSEPLKKTNSSDLTLRVRLDY